MRSDSIQHALMSDEELAALMVGDVQTEVSSSRKRIVSVRDVPSIWELKTPELEWGVEDLIQAKSIAMIAGASGVGKSMLALDLGGKILRGLPFLGRKTKASPVLFLDRESPQATFRERLDLLSIEAHSDFHVWGMWCDPEPPHPGAASILEFARERHPTIFIDSLVAFHDGDEQNATDTRKFFQVLRRLATAGATVLVLHHTGKGEGTKDYRGSSDIAASVDSAFVLERAEGSNGLERLALRCFKMRCAEVPEKIAIELSDGNFTASTDPYILENVRGREQLRTFLRATPGANQSDVLAAMRSSGSARNVADRTLKQAVADGEVTETKSGRHSKTYTPSELLELEL